MGAIFLKVKLGKLSTVSKRPFMFVPPFGLAIYMTDGIFIDNTKKNASRSVMDKAMLKLKASKVAKKSFQANHP